MTGRMNTAAMIGLMIGLFASPAAQAVIKVELPVSKMVQQARAVVVGKVSEVEVSRGVMDVEVTETTKGSLPKSAQRFRLQIADAEQVKGIIEAVKAGQPVVAFLAAGDRTMVVHLADRWLAAQQVALLGGEPNTPVWRVAQSHEGSASFPGRTVALADVVREIKAGATGLQDWVSHEVCLGGVFKRDDAGVKGATFMISADLNDDGLPEVVVGNEKEAQLLVARGKTYHDETEKWKLGGARGAKAASADINGDGVVDLIIGSQIWMRSGDTFIAGAKLELGDPKGWIAMGAGDSNGDGKADVAVLSRSGRMVVCDYGGGTWKASSAQLWKDDKEALAAAFANDFGDDGRLHVMVVREDGISRYAADPGAGGGVSDFKRLTGIPLSAYSLIGTPIKPLLTASYDYDGLGRTDFIVVTEAGGIALANRGHGAFLVNRFAHEQFRPGGRDIKLPKLPFEPTLTGVLTAPGRQVQMQPKRKRGNLLVLTEQGELWEMENERVKK